MLKKVKLQRVQEINLFQAWIFCSKEILPIKLYGIAHCKQDHLCTSNGTSQPRLRCLDYSGIIKMTILGNGEKGHIKVVAYAQNTWMIFFLVY